MVQPSPSYTVALYLEVPASQKAVASLVDTATATGAIVTGGDAAGCKTVVRAGQRYCGRLGPQTTGGEKGLHVLIPRQRIRWAFTIMRR